MVSRKHLQDIKKIMSIEEEMLRLLPTIEHKVLNPYGSKLSTVFKKLNLKKRMVVLDIPCGKGTVSIPLAKKYGVSVYGYDVLKDYVTLARKEAQKQKVASRCHFNVGDIRDIVKKSNICNVLLWIAAPHLWKTAQETIKHLRNAVKNGGLIIIGDAYVKKKRTKLYEDYEPLAQTTTGFTAFGDELIQFYDYKATLWDEDYKRTVNPALKALKLTKDKRDKKIIHSYIQKLKQEEKNDKKYLGVAIWVMKVKK